MTEKNMENHLRNLIKDKVLSNVKNFYMLDSKDITDIICCKNGDMPLLYFLELKHYSSTNGRIGFGSSGKKTFQVEILKERPSYFEKYLRWIFCDENFSNYYILDNEACQKYIMGDSVSYDKQNNFRLTLFKKERKFSEQELCDYLINWFSE